jgi:hypothetical protein
VVDKSRTQIPAAQIASDLRPLFFPVDKSGAIGRRAFLFRLCMVCMVVEPRCMVVCMFANVDKSGAIGCGAFLSLLCMVCMMKLKSIR